MEGSNVAQKAAGAAAGAGTDDHKAQRSRKRGRKAPKKDQAPNAGGQDTDLSRTVTPVASGSEGTHGSSERPSLQANTPKKSSPAKLNKKQKRQAAAAAAAAVAAAAANADGAGDALLNVGEIDDPALLALQSAEQQKYIKRALRKQRKAARGGKRVFPPPILTTRSKHPDLIELPPDFKEPTEVLSEKDLPIEKDIFFLDSAPSKLKKNTRRDLDAITKPTLPSMPGRAERAQPQSTSTADHEKLLPDYVGNQQSIHDVTKVGDEEAKPLQGSSRDLLPSSAGSKGKGKAVEQHDQDELICGHEVLPQSNNGQAGNLFHQEQRPGIVQETASSSGLGENARTTGETSRTAGNAAIAGSMQDRHSSPQNGHSSAMQDLGPSTSRTQTQRVDDVVGDDLGFDIEFDTVGAPRKATPEPSSPIGDFTATSPIDAFTDSLSGSPREQEPAGPALPVVPEAGAENVNVEEEAIMDDEHQPDRSRYFKEEDPLRLCARCGETGHTSRDCEHVQCLTCGKLDDHGTRACPLTMTCFRCNGRGHHIKDCPVTPGQARASANQYCERCSSHTHKSSTCPYIWRVYIRAADAPTVKSPKLRLACYNCASDKHYGDDCKMPRGHPVPNNERTAFTLEANRPRKQHLKFQDENQNPNPMPRPNIVNGRRQMAPLPERPNRDSKAARAVQSREDARNRMSERPSLENQLKRDGDFGDMGDLEAGEVDEEEEAFAKRLSDVREADQNGKQRSRPGARDRRNARSRTGSPGSTGSGGPSNTRAPRKAFQPFKHFQEPPTSSSLERPHSLSGSPPPRKRRRDERQPSPEALQSLDNRLEDRDRRSDRDDRRDLPGTKPWRAELQSEQRSRGGHARGRGPGRGRGRGRGDRGDTYRPPMRNDLLDRIERPRDDSRSTRDPRSYQEDHRRADSRSRDEDRSSYRGGSQRYRGGYF